MAEHHADTTSDYLSSTRSVLQAATRLRKALDADVAKREFAITELEQAAEQQQGGATGFRSFMFSELETAAEPASDLRERVAEDTLASISADLHVANTLIAAGVTVGEVGPGTTPRRLNEAILRLDNVTQTIEQSLPNPLAEPKRFGFAEVVSSPQGVTSPDLPSATATFRQRADQALDAFVSDARGAVGDVIETLSDTDAGKVLEAIRNLGGAMEVLPKIGRLVRLGIERLGAAVDTLTRLIGSEALAAIRDKVKHFWENAQKDKPLEGLLAWVFGIEGARAHAAEVLQTKGLKLEALDQGSTKLGQLPDLFREKMGIATSLASVVTVVGTVLSFIPAIGANAALVAATIDVLILASVILIGRDHTDSGDLLHWVPGVQEIASEVRSA